MRLPLTSIALLVGLLVVEPAFADSASPSGAVIAKLDIEGEKDRAEVVIRGSFKVPTYSIRTLNDGKKVVVEVADAVLEDGGIKINGTAALVVNSVASTSARGVRLVLDLTREATYRARSDEGQIQLSFEAVGAEPASEATPSADGPLQMQHVILERRNGRERVVAEFNKPTPFRVLPGSRGPARLEVRGATISPSAAKQLAGVAGSVVRGVTVKQQTGRVLFEVDRESGSSATAIREGNRIVWMFAPAQRKKPNSADVRTVARERAVEIDGDQVAAFLSDVPMQIGGTRGKAKFTGRKIDLDFKDADIHNILRLLSEVGNINVITADDVGGTVTIKMRGVPWDQALDVILTAKGLGMIRRGNLIRVAPQGTLEKEREMAIARKKQQIELAPLETRLIPVSYGSAGDMSARAGELVSERGRVSVDDRTNILVVRDVSNNLDDIEELVRSLDSQTPQVLIEARIVEATTAFTHDFGIQWGGSLIMGSATGNPTGLVFPHDVTVAGGATDGSAPTAGLSPFSSSVANPNYVVNFPAPAGTGQGGAIGLSLGSIAGNFNLALRLSAFETTGQVRIISSPRILTLDNEEASISQGTAIPYSQVSAQGVQTAFQEAKLSLAVTPHVTSDGAVQMTVDITRDEPDFNQTSARGDPTILKRQANTNLLVQDGHTAVIGGIYTRNTGRGIQKVPFFGDIPIIGILFSHSTYRDGRNELLIFLTPRIVNRAQALDR